MVMMRYSNDGSPTNRPLNSLSFWATLICKRYNYHWL